MFERFCRPGKRSAEAVGCAANGNRLLQIGEKKNPLNLWATLLMVANCWGSTQLSVHVPSRREDIGPWWLALDDQGPGTNDPTHQPRRRRTLFMSSLCWQPSPSRLSVPIFAKTLLLRPEWLTLWAPSKGLPCSGSSTNQMVV